MASPRAFLLAALLTVAVGACAPSLRLDARSRPLSRPGASPLILTEVDARPGTVPPRATVLVVRRPGDAPIGAHLRAVSGFAMMGMRVAFAEPSRSEDAVADVRKALDEVLGGEPSSSRAVVLVGTHAREETAAKVAAEDGRVTHLLLLGGAGEGALGDVRAPTLAVVGDAPCPEGARVSCARHEGLAPGLADQPLLPRVEVDVVRWLGATGVLDPAEVGRFEGRVRREHEGAFAR